MEIGYIDFSREERNKILNTLSLLNEKTAIDELGIGRIRDAYADILFPGISTLHTRAKYFVIIPYLFALANEQELEDGKEFLKCVQQKEDSLVRILMENSEGETGIIGINSHKQKKSIKNRPSSIYWSALRTLEILQNPLFSLGTACNTAYGNMKSKTLSKEFRVEKPLSSDDPNATFGSTPIFSSIPLEYGLDKITISLTPLEAQFLKDKIFQSSNTNDSLLRYLLQSENLPNTFDDVNSFNLGILSDKIRTAYIFAKNFSSFIYGIHLRYNIIFSNYTDEKIAKEFTDWQSSFFGKNKDYELDDTFDFISMNDSSTVFCKAALNLVKQANFVELDKLIVSREISIKKDRAKLCKPAEYKYNPKAPVHYHYLDFRYNRAKVIIEDILNGLKGK